MEIKCSFLDPPSIRGSGEIRATKAAVSAGAHGKQSFSGGCLMGRFRLLAVHSDICLDDRTFLIFLFGWFLLLFGLLFFYCEHTETLEQIIQGGNRLTPAPGV